MPEESNRPSLLFHDFVTHIIAEVAAAAGIHFYRGELEAMEFEVISSGDGPRADTRPVITIDPSSGGIYECDPSVASEYSDCIGLCDGDLQAMAACVDCAEAAKPETPVAEPAPNAPKIYGPEGRFRDRNGNLFDYVFPGLLHDPGFPPSMLPTAQSLEGSTGLRFTQRYKEREETRLVIGFRPSQSWINDRVSRYREVVAKFPIREPVPPKPLLPGRRVVRPRMASYSSGLASAAS